MISCIAIDDEPIALSILERFCQRHGGIEIATFTSPREGMVAINLRKPDVVFMDIEMNDISGVELARRLPPVCCLIFTTAYARYALDGFEVNAVDFLHKPFFYDRFCRAIDKAERWIEMQHLLHSSCQPERLLMLKSDYKTVPVSIDNILYVESIDNYVRFHLVNGDTVMSKMPLRTVEDMLPRDEFIKIHRSYVVARNKVSRFSHSELYLGENAKALPIGRTYADAVAQVLAGKK